MYNVGSDVPADQRGAGGRQRKLTDDDYDYELELDFPPEGSEEKSIRGSRAPPLYATPPHKLAKSFKFKVGGL